MMNNVAIQHNNFIGNIQYGFRGNKNNPVEVTGVDLASTDDLLSEGSDVYLKT